MTTLLTALLWISVTSAAYWIARVASRHLGGHPALNPVLWGAALVIATLLLTKNSYQTYAIGGDWLLWSLGPATVALAHPLATLLDKIRAVALPFCAALLAGSFVALATVISLGLALGASTPLLLASSTKSVTTAIAIPLAELLQAPVSLAALCVLLTGVMGAVIIDPLLTRAGLSDERARGLALGAIAHGIGTARAFEGSATAGAYASAAMTLHGIFTAFYLPLFIHLLTFLLN
jgi:putative effector of murein hydrolase